MSERGEIKGQCNHSTYYNLLAGMKSFTMLPMTLQVGKRCFSKGSLFPSFPFLSFLFSSGVRSSKSDRYNNLLPFFLTLFKKIQIHPAPVCIIRGNLLHIILGKSFKTDEFASINKP